MTYDSCVALPYCYAALLSLDPGLGSLPRSQLQCHGLLFQRG